MSSNFSSQIPELLPDVGKSNLQLRQQRDQPSSRSTSVHLHGHLVSPPFPCKRPCRQPLLVLHLPGAHRARRLFHLHVRGKQRSSLLFAVPDDLHLRDERHCEYMSTQSAMTATNAQ